MVRTSVTSFRLSSLSSRAIASSHPQQSFSGAEREIDRRADQVRSFFFRPAAATSAYAAERERAGLQQLRSGKLFSGRFKTSTTICAEYGTGIASTNPYEH